MSGKPVACVALPLEDDLRSRIAEVCEVIPVAPDAKASELAAALEGADGLLVSNRCPVDDALLAAAPRLKVVSGFGVGYDLFDVEAATRRGIAVCNTPEVVTEPVANLTLAMLLMASRRLVEHATYTRAGWAAYEPLPPLGRELRDKTLGIVGFGRIGQEVARRAPVFGLRLVYHDVFAAPPPGAPAAQRLSFDELLREADFVTLHVDLNPSSRHLVGARELALMRETAWLVNTSRGGVVDPHALAEALRKGEIAGAAVDVLEREPPDAQDPLLSLPGFFAFPHIGTATVETRRAMAELCVENLLAVLGARTPPACVNPGVLGAASGAQER